ncbi:MAG: flagellar hook-length control protein FliK [Roseobacter sp.]
MDLPFLQNATKSDGGYSAPAKPVRDSDNGRRPSEEFGDTYEAEGKSVQQQKDGRASDDAPGTQSAQDKTGQEKQTKLDGVSAGSEAIEQDIDDTDARPRVQIGGDDPMDVIDVAVGNTADAQKQKAKNSVELSETIFRQQIVAGEAQESGFLTENVVAKSGERPVMSNTAAVASQGTNPAVGISNPIVTKALVSETGALNTNKQSEAVAELQGDSAKLAGMKDGPQASRGVVESIPAPQQMGSKDAARLAEKGQTELRDISDRKRNRAEQVTEVSARREAPEPVVQKPQITVQSSVFALQGQDQRLTAQSEAGSFDLLKVDGLGAEFSSVKDTRVTQTTSLNQVLARGETSAMVGRQMAEALHRMPDQPVQLALSPKELGKVKMSISAGEQGITVSVIAERQETLDLMRRNINDLAKEFHSMGYSDVNFAFSEGRSDEGQMNSDQKSPDGNGPFDGNKVAENSVPNVIQMVASEGLDLRL